MWPTPSPASAFIARRKQLQQRLRSPALFASGFSAPRNFAANRQPFRAESHFLYFVGRAIEGAALLVTLAAGFVAGLWWLDALIRRRHGGFRVY